MDHFETDLTKLLGIKYPIMCAGNRVSRHLPTSAHAPAACCIARPRVRVAPSLLTT